MKALMTSILIGFSIALYAQLSQAQEGFRASFLDWADTSPYRAQAKPATEPESSQQTRPAEEPGTEQATEIALSALPSRLSPKLANLQPGQPLLEDILVMDESPLEVDPEALADMQYHETSTPVAVQIETGATSIAATLKQLFQ